MPSSIDGQSKEIQHVFNVLTVNGYPEPFLKNCLNLCQHSTFQRDLQQDKHKSNQSMNQENLEESGQRITIPYVQGVSERITRVLSKYRITKQSIYYSIVIVY